MRSFNRVYKIYECNSKHLVCAKQNGRAFEGLLFLRKSVHVRRKKTCRVITEGHRHPKRKKTRVENLKVKRCGHVHPTHPSFISSHRVRCSVDDRASNGPFRSWTHVGAVPPIHRRRASRAHARRTYSVHRPISRAMLRKHALSHAATAERWRRRPGAAQLPRS